eukprot:g5398.t1
MDVILFYKYVEGGDGGGGGSVEEARNFQEATCRELGLCGRVLVSAQGINGTLAGAPADIAKYKAAVEERMGAVQWKESKCDIGEEPFPDLFIKIVKELVSSDGMKYDVVGGGGGKHLTPEEFHAAVSTRDSEVVILDVRNRFEYAVGHFKDAVHPNMRNFSQFKDYIDKEADGLLKGKDVLMYCTGGIRCESASAYLKSKGTAKAVYQLSGGIHKYAEAVPPEESLFEGKNFVFDRRMVMDTGTAPVGRCSECGKIFDELSSGVVCTVCVCLVLVCPDCREHGVKIAGSELRRHEWYCEEHTNLRASYFFFLDHFPPDELRRQVAALEAILDGLPTVKNDVRQRRRTVERQLRKQRWY